MDECDASIQTKTADTAHTGIFSSVTRPFPDFRVGPGNEASFVVLTHVKGCGWYRWCVVIEAMVDCVDISTCACHWNSPKPQSCSCMV